jgi:hypothetical protein
LRLRFAANEHDAERRHADTPTRTLASRPQPDYFPFIHDLRIPRIW